LERDDLRHFDPSWSVSSRKSQESVDAGEYPAWDEPGQFLSMVRSAADERR
jgi:hypothetical protein